MPSTPSVQRDFTGRSSHLLGRFARADALRDDQFTRFAAQPWQV